MAALAGLEVGNTEVAAGAGLLGGITKASLAHVFAPKGLYSTGVITGCSLGAAAAVAGALGAKSWSDDFESVHAVRLAEVRSHARLTAHPDVYLGPAMRQLLTSFNWCLSVEERRRGGLSGGTNPLNLGPFFGGEDESGDGDVSVGGTQRSLDKEMRRQVKRIWRLCDAPPLRTMPKRGSGGIGQKASSRSSNKSKGKEKNDDWRIPHTPAYEKLFNPQYHSVTNDKGLCAALCYLVGSFIRLRKKAPGGLNDGERASLRLAVAALARHPVFDEELPDKDEKGSTMDTDTIEFRRGALALIPLLDAALAWKPVDPWGWLGACEDDAPLLVAHTKGLCSFPALAARLKKSLNKAASGDTVTWRRLSVHLDSIRIRELPHPWSWIWLQAQDSSMLVRNHTKVPLRVELYRPPASRSSPWADWPLLDAIMSLGGLLAAKEDEALIVADVGPGIEWAMRPKAHEGRHFELKLVTEHGVVVCSKRLRRGQTFDFRVNVPEHKRPVVRRALENHSVVAEKDVLASLAAGKEKDIDADDQSVCSTAAPPSMSSSRLSISSAASASTTATLASPDQMTTVGTSLSTPLEGIDEMHRERVEPAWTTPESIDAAICPRCLREMHSRFTRPTAATYAEGVECDRCSTKIMEVEGSEGPSESSVAFFHCRRCWFDLCQSCAYREMQDVWWDDD